MLLVAFNVPPLLLKKEVLLKVKVEFVKLMPVLAVMELVPETAKLILEKLIVEEPLPEACRLRAMLLIEMLSELNEHDWQVKSLLMETLPPVNVQFAHVRLPLSILSVAPEEILNVHELQ